MLKIVGCTCYLCLRPYQKHKFNFHSQRCVFLSYGDSHKGYKCLSSSGRTYISKHVVFNELEFLFKSDFINKLVQPQTFEIAMSFLPLVVGSNHKTIPQILTDTTDPGASPAVSFSNKEIKIEVEGESNDAEINQEELVGHEQVGVQQGECDTKGTTDDVAIQVQNAILDIR